MRPENVNGLCAWPCQGATACEVLRALLAGVVCRLGWYEQVVCSGEHHLVMCCAVLGCFGPGQGVTGALWLRLLNGGDDSAFHIEALVPVKLANGASAGHVPAS